MRLYLDDNLMDRRLAGLLRKAGPMVVLPADVGMVSASDPRLLLYAIQQGLTLLSGNHKDFRDLYKLVIGSGGSHSGILLVYFDNDSTRDMRPPTIVRAIAKLETSGTPLANALHVLNQWR